VLNIRVAEAAKVIENTQRDLNIALANEFALIFKKMGLDTKEVLDAAVTSWKFLPFKPGQVGRPIQTRMATLQIRRIPVPLIDSITLAETTQLSYSDTWSTGRRAR